jgi:hypothetical protein
MKLFFVVDDADRSNFVAAESQAQIYALWENRYHTRAFELVIWEVPEPPSKAGVYLWGSDVVRANPEK